MADANLAAALKQAKGKKMFFAFIPKGAEGTLIVSKARIPPKQIADAKKEAGAGCGNPLTGKCFADGNNMVFQVVKPGPSTLAAAIKKVIHRDAGLTLMPDIQLAGDADADEDSAAAPPAGSGTKSPGGAPAPPAAAPAAGGAPPPPAGETAAGGGTAPPGTPNLGPWQAAREHTIKDLKALAAKVVATKHGSAPGVLKEINSIIAKLPLIPKREEIDKLEAFVRHDETITAAEEVPAHFHKLEIREPLLKALEGLKA